MNMRKLAAFVMFSATLAGVTACEDDSEGPDDDTEVFTATLNAAQEPPTGGVAVVSSGTGTARVELTPTGLTYTVNITSPLTTAITLAHIHGSPTSVPGVNAGVLINLNPNLTITTGTLAQGVATGPTTNNAAISMDSLKVLMRAGLTYVNVHTSRYGGGEIRGQLLPAN
jgi:hypothetical protein